MDASDALFALVIAHPLLAVLGFISYIVLTVIDDVAKRKISFNDEYETPNWLRVTYSTSDPRHSKKALILALFKEKAAAIKTERGIKMHPAECKVYWLYYEETVNEFHNKNFTDFEKRQIRKELEEKFSEHFKLAAEAVEEDLGELMSFRAQTNNISDRTTTPSIQAPSLKQ